MLCPKCSSIDDKVIDSRLSKDGTSIRRRRECLGCESRFTTYEQIERVELLAVKRDNRREPFDRQKLFSSFIKACEKRPISVTVMEEAVNAIISDFESGQDREIPTKVIGARVMERLHAIDPVAYVRFASVYRRFEDIGEFIEEIQSLERRAPTSDDQRELFHKNALPVS
jgi:transcriptional repressor NrdR